MDDEALIQELLYRGECTTLDYKAKQYPFSGAEDSQKSELLKDILAFANAWRSETAYILIGVRNGSGELVELDSDIDDSRLQEFVNSKTNHPVSFSYRSLEYLGVRLGLFTIPTQDRPVYIRKQFGRVLANTIYVRRGSATAIADPSEIAKMGAATVPKTVQYSPKLSVGIVGADLSVSDRLLVNQTQWKLMDGGKYCDYSAADEPGLVHRMMVAMLNKNFYREHARYLQESRGKESLLFEVSNNGDNFADDVKLYIHVPVFPGVSFKESYRLLSKPQKVFTVMGASGTADGLKMGYDGCSIRRTDKEFVIRFDLGKIQVGEVVRTPRIYMINPSSAIKEIRGKVISDQLRCPVGFVIPAEINVNAEVLTLEDLIRLS